MCLTWKGTITLYDFAATRTLYWHKTKRRRLHYDTRHEEIWTSSGCGNLLMKGHNSFLTWLFDCTQSGILSVPVPESRSQLANFPVQWMAANNPQRWHFPENMSTYIIPPATWENSYNLDQPFPSLSTAWRIQHGRVYSSTHPCVCAYQAAAAAGLWYVSRKTFLISCFWQPLLCLFTQPSSSA